MKTKQVYIADDGRQFDTHGACIMYENQCAYLRRAIGPLGDPAEIHGDAFVQHDPATVLECRNTFLDACFDILGDWTREAIDGQKRQNQHNFCLIGRIIDDSNHRTMNKIWARLMCIDPVTGREHGQPYYAKQAYDKRAAA